MRHLLTALATRPIVPDDSSAEYATFWRLQALADEAMRAYELALAAQHAINSLRDLELYERLGRIRSRLHERAMRRMRAARDCGKALWAQDNVEPAQSPPAENLALPSVW